ESWALPAYGQKAAVIGGDLDEITGSFQVVSNQPLTGLCFLFAEAMTVMYDVPGTQIPKNRLDIPHVAQDDMWGMRLMLSNPGNQPLTATLTYRDQAGIDAGQSHSVGLAAGGSTVLDLGEIIGTWGLAGMTGGSLQLSADQSGIVAFSTYDDLKNGGSFYAGLPAFDSSLGVDNFTPLRAQYAVVSCTAPDYGSGAHALIEVAKPRAFQQNLLPTISDIKMAADGAYFYRIECFNGDNVTKFAAADPATPLWQYSTLDPSEAGSSNPQSMSFVPATPSASAKAYIPRYGSTKLWVVDPQAAGEAEFKVGEIDLGAYADSDGLPEMSKGVVVGDKLFLILGRLDADNGFVPTNTPYLVVIDTATDTEIDTQGGGPEGFHGIPLPIKNPLEIVYNAATGKIFVQGVGRYASSWTGTPAEYSGGIVSVDPATYQVEMIVDDGDDLNHPYGNIRNVAVVSATRGYFVSYASWGNTALYGFNPGSGVVDAAPLAAFPGGSNIMDLGVDAQGLLWVCSNSNAGGALTIINPADDSVDQIQTLSLNPQGIAFGTW
ncbi:MAG: hypothetical protein JXR89_12500, partial [Deltaproteobacteria bacterium]|nr:hypothetical protein [Deltaproteobacteria bacterium]